MITSKEYFLNLIELGSVEARQKLTTETASEKTWFEIMALSNEIIDAVVLNKTLPPKVLRHLALHESSRIRSHIAMKRALPIDLFETLASDKDESVRARISWNKKTPINIIRNLARDVAEVVSEPALARLEKEGLE